MSAARSKSCVALVDLLGEDREWRRFFKRCCSCGPLRLRSQASQFRAALAERGHALRLVDVEDALAVLAGELLPDTPAAAWDEEWAHELMRDALAYVGEWCAGRALPSSAFVDDREITTAALAEDQIAYREAVRSWAKATLRVLKAEGEAIVPKSFWGLSRKKSKAAHVAKLIRSGRANAQGVEIA